jgi:hypothetical protein
VGRVTVVSVKLSEDNEMPPAEQWRSTAPVVKGATTSIDRATSKLSPTLLEIVSVTEALDAKATGVASRDTTRSPLLTVQFTVNASVPVVLTCLVALTVKMAVRTWPLVKAVPPLSVTAPLQTDCVRMNGTAIGLTAVGAGVGGTKAAMILGLRREDLVLIWLAVDKGDMVLLSMPAGAGDMVSVMLAVRSRVAVWVWSLLLSVGAGDTVGTTLAVDVRGIVVLSV